MKEKEKEPEKKMCDQSSPKILDKTYSSQTKIPMYFILLLINFERDCPETTLICINNSYDMGPSALYWSTKTFLIASVDRFFFLFDLSRKQQKHLRKLYRRKKKPP